MTELSTAPAATLESQNLTVPAIPAAAPTAPVLITEQQVLFATAAAVAPPRERAAWFATLLHAAAGIFARPERPERPEPRRRPPARCDFLERSMMAREMYRL